MSSLLIIFLSPVGKRLGEGVTTNGCVTFSPNLSPKGERRMKARCR